MILRLVDDLLKRAFGSSKPRPYERTCIAAWRATLSVEAQAILDAQMAAYDLIQRESGDKIVSFYRIGRRARPLFAPAQTFPDRDDGNKPVATLALRRAGEGQACGLRVQITVVAGRLFGLEFSRPPAQFLGADLARADVEVASISTWRDPMQVRQPAPARRAIALDAWPDDLATPGAPAPAWLAADVALPADYRALVDRHGAVALSGWRVAALDEIRKIPLPEATHHVLAEREGGDALTVIEGDRSGMIHFLACADSGSTPLGTSLHDALLAKEVTE